MLIAFILTQCKLLLDIVTEQCGCFVYSEHPKILYTKVSDKMTYANSAEPAQNALEEAVWSGFVCYSRKYFNRCYAE